MKTPVFTRPNCLLQNITKLSFLLTQLIWKIINRNFLSHCKFLCNNHCFFGSVGATVFRWQMHQDRISHCWRQLLFHYTPTARGWTAAQLIKVRLEYEVSTIGSYWWHGSCSAKLWIMCSGETSNCNHSKKNTDQIKVAYGTIHLRHGNF